MLKKKRLSWRQKTMVLLENTNKPTSLVSEETGLSVRWLNMLKAGDIPNPGIKSMWKLYKYLGGR